VRERKVAMTGAIRTSCRCFRIVGIDVGVWTHKQPSRLPAQNLTKNPYQSRSIIGRGDGLGNLSKGHRTTVVIYVNC
jgi:hypothetical protein